MSAITVFILLGVFLYDVSGDILPPLSGMRTIPLCMLLCLIVAFPYCRDRS